MGCFYSVYLPWLVTYLVVASLCLVSSVFVAKCRFMYCFGRLIVSMYPGLKVKCFILKMIQNTITMVYEGVLNINDV